MDYKNQFQSSALDEIAAYNVATEEHRVVLDNSFNGNELDHLTAGVSDNISIITSSMIVDGNVNSGAAISLKGRVNGNVTTSNDIGVSGLVVGDIEAENVHFQHAGIRGNTTAMGVITAENDSIVVGDISANTATIDGKVKGTVKTNGLAEFKRNALIVGQIVSGSILMDEDARINATITLVNQKSNHVDDSEFDLGV